MKKILSIVVILLMVVSVSVAQARVGDSRVGAIRANSMVVDTCTHVSVGPSYVYSITINAQTAAGWGALIDSNTTGGYDSTSTFVAAAIASGSTVYKAFVQEATQYDMTQVTFDPPLYFKNGIFFYDGVGPVTTSGGSGVIAIVEYEGE